MLARPASSAASFTMFARSAPVAPAAAVRELMSSCDAMHAELQQLCDVTCAPCMSMTAAGCRARTRRQARQVVQGHVARQRQGAPLYMYLASQAGPQRAFCRACKQTAHPVEESKCSCLCICVQNIALWSASSGFQALAAGAAAAAQRECLLEPCSVWRALTADDCKTAARAAGGQIQWSGPLSGACVNTEPAAERRGGGGGRARTSRICSRPQRSGRSTFTVRSKRPGRSSAWSSTCACPTGPQGIQPYSPSLFLGGFRAPDERAAMRAGHLPQEAPPAQAQPRPGRSGRSRAGAALRQRLSHARARALQRSTAACHAQGPFQACSAGYSKATRTHARPCKG